jgi:hypothetical protein
VMFTLKIKVNAPEEIKRYRDKALFSLLEVPNFCGLGIVFCVFR